MVLLVRVGNYQSPPAAILDNGEFVNLVIVTDDESLIGAPMQFFLNEELSTPVVAETPDDEEEDGGICSSTSGLPFEQSAANMLVLFAPVVMLGGAKYIRGRRRNDQII